MHESIRKTLVGMISIGLFVALAGYVSAEEAPSISPSALAERRAGNNAPLVVDVRTTAEFETGQ